MTWNRWRRFVLGEGLTKKSADLASEVEEQTKAMQAAAADRKVEEEAAPAPEPEGIKDEDVPDFKVATPHSKTSLHPSTEVCLL